MNFILLISSIVSAVEVDFETFSTAYLAEFSKGFFSGVADENADCTLSVSRFHRSISTLIDRVSTYDGSYVPILTGLSSLNKDLSSVHENCNLKRLSYQVHKILGPSGKTIMMKNYFLNLSQINKNLATMEKCRSNFFNCGKAAGEAFRLLSGYSLQGLEENLEAPSNKDLMDLFYGFATTAQWTVTDDCVELTGKFANLKSVVAEIQSIINGPVENLISSIQKLLSLLEESSDIAECAMQYGGVALYAMPSIFFHKQIWKNAWESEGDTLTDLISKMSVACHKDYKACGSFMGQVFNTLGPYIEDLRY